MIQPIIDYDISEHRYFIDPVNSQDNERIVELRLAIDWYEELCGLDRKQNIVEVGNVLGFYGYSEHLCIDKFAEIPLPCVHINGQWVAKMERHTNVTDNVTNGRTSQNEAVTEKVMTLCSSHDCTHHVHCHNTNGDQEG